MMKKISVWTLCALLLAGCATNEKITGSGLLQSNFQTEVDSKKTDLYVLRNANNMEVCVMNFGGRIVSVMVPDKEGIMRDVVLGFDSIQDYITIPSDFGASIGRYANRINQGRFMLDSVEYILPRNNYGHCLHGGPKGFQYQVYDARQIGPQELELTYLAKDGEEGFPGNNHNWVLNTKGDITCKCATLQSSKTGIILDVYTNEPGIQVYAGNFLDGTVKGKKGIIYNQRASVCLETQKYPDTPNKPEWPSAVLRPGEKYHSHCIFKFSVDK